MIETNKIYCSDCLDIMRDMPDDSVDLCLTDPPYGINFGSEKESMSAGLRKDGSQRVYNKWSNPTPKKYSNWDDTKPTIDVFNEIFRISKKQIIWGGNYFELPISGGWLIWDKQVVMPTLSKCELAWTSFMGHTEIKRYLWAGFRKEKPEERYHTTQKPFELMAWCLSFVDETDLIFDPFCGSGTTCVAAKRLGRDYIGIDISEEYCKIARDRLAAEEAGLTVKEMKKGQRSMFNEKD